jgi:hypothetical protein
MTALARKLQSRGHEVVFIGVPDTEPIVRAAGLTFVPYCEEEFPVASMEKAYSRGEDARTRGQSGCPWWQNGCLTRREKPGNTLVHPIFPRCKAGSSRWGISVRLCEVAFHRLTKL